MQIPEFIVHYTEIKFYYDNFWFWFLQIVALALKPYLKKHSCYYLIKFPVEYKIRELGSVWVFLFALQLIPVLVGIVLF